MKCSPGRRVAPRFQPDSRTPSARAARCSALSRSTPVTTSGSWALYASSMAARSWSHQPKTGWCSRSVRSTRSANVPRTSRTWAAYSSADHPGSGRSVRRAHGWFNIRLSHCFASSRNAVQRSSRGTAAARRPHSSHVPSATTATQSFSVTIPIIAPQPSRGWWVLVGRPSRRTPRRATVRRGVFASRIDKGRRADRIDSSGHSRAEKRSHIWAVSLTTRGSCQRPSAPHYSGTDGAPGNNGDHPAPDEAQITPDDWRSAFGLLVSGVLRALPGRCPGVLRRTGRRGTPAEERRRGVSARASSGSRTLTSAGNLFAECRRHRQAR